VCLHVQVLQEALKVVQCCQDGEAIKQLWNHKPLVQAQHSQQQRAAGKPAGVSTGSPAQQQKVQQLKRPADDVKGMQDVGGH
jgi:hypothetical protein